MARSEQEDMDESLTYDVEWSWQKATPTGKAKKKFTGCSSRCKRVHYKRRSFALEKEIHQLREDVASTRRNLVEAQVKIYAAMDVLQQNLDDVDLKSLPRIWEAVNILSQA